LKSSISISNKEEERMAITKLMLDQVEIRILSSLNRFCIRHKKFLGRCENRASNEAVYKDKIIPCCDNPLCQESAMRIAFYSAV